MTAVSVSVGFEPGAGAGCLASYSWDVTTFCSNA